MATILDTLGIATCTVSYGKEASFAGKPATVTILVTPMALAIGQLRLTWAATGDIFSSFNDTTSGDPGMPGIIVLPQTGQTGFRHGTATFKDWFYLAVVTSTLADGQQQSRTYRFQIPAGMTTLDLDMLDEDGVVTALPAIAPILPQTALSRIPVKTAAYTAGPNELVPVDATAAAVTVTAPAAPADKTRLLVKKLDTTTNVVTLATSTGDVFNKTAGTTTVTLQLPNQAVTAQYDAGTAIWTVLSDDLPLTQLDNRYPTAASVANTYLAKASAAPVATSGAYSDLSGKPTIPSTPTQVGAEPAGLSATTSAAIGSQISLAVAGVVAGAPAALDTLLEIAQQLQADESGAAALAATVATKQNASQVAAAIATQAAADATTYDALPSFLINTGSTLSATTINKVDASSTTQSRALPPPAANGKVTVKKTDTSSNTVAVTGHINGVAGSTVNLVWYQESIEFRSDGTTWEATYGHKRKSDFDRDYGVYVNCKSFPFYAKGDNSSDDSAALQAAINSVAAAGGGTAFFPLGIYRVGSAVLLRSNVRLAGVGRGSQILAATNANLPQVIGLWDVNQVNYGLQDIAVSGNKANGNSTSIGVNFVTTGGTGGGNNRPFIRGLYVEACGGDGVYLTGRGSGNYTDVQVYNCDGVGLHLGLCYDSFFTSVDVGQSGLAGVRVEGSNNHFVNCNAWYSGRVTASAGAGWAIVAPRNQFISCSAQDNKSSGFAIYNGAVRTMLLGFTADSNGSSGNGTASGQTGYGVAISSDITDSTISGQAFDRYIPPTQAAGVSVPQAAYPQNIIQVREVGNVAASASAGVGYKYSRASRTNGNVTITSTSLVAIDTAIDLTVAAAAGDLLEIGLNAQAANNAAVNLDFNVLLLVSGNESNRVGGATTTGTIAGWGLRGGDYYGTSSVATYTVQAADLTSNGLVTLRLMALASTATGRPILANTGAPLTWWVRNVTR